MPIKHEYQIQCLWCLESWSSPTMAKEHATTATQSDKNINLTSQISQLKHPCLLSTWSLMLQKFLAKSHALWLSIELMNNGKRYQLGIRKTCTYDHPWVHLLHEVSMITLCIKRQKTSIWSLEQICYLWKKKTDIVIVIPNPNFVIVNQKDYRAKHLRELHKQKKNVWYSPLKLFLLIWLLKL